MRFLTSLFLTVHCLLAHGQSTRNDPKLDRQLRAALAGFRGDVGLYVRNLRTGRTVAINAGTTFPTASTIKIPIQCGLFDKIHRGELTYGQELIYRDSLHYDNGLAGSLKDGTKVPLSVVVMLMETVSGLRKVVVTADLIRYF